MLSTEANSIYFNKGEKDGIWRFKIR
jgi:hypothetical protein